MYICVRTAWKDPVGLVHLEGSPDITPNTPLTGMTSVRSENTLESS